VQLFLCCLKVLILKKGLDIHRDKVPEALQPFHAHMESRYHEMKIVLEREYGIKVSWFVRACLFFYEKKMFKMPLMAVWVLVTII